MYQPLSIYILVYTTYLTEAHFDVMSKPYRYIYISTHPCIFKTAPGVAGERGLHKAQAASLA
jgi:hypothetical protein